MNPLHIYSKITDVGVELGFRDIPYPIKYPAYVWEETPKETRTGTKG